MKIRTRTREEAKVERERWKLKLALFPVKVADGDWRWLERVEYREFRIEGVPTIVFRLQHRAIGSQDCWPPQTIGRLDKPPIVERRSNRAMRSTDLNGVEFPKSKIVKDYEQR